MQIFFFKSFLLGFSNLYKHNNDRKTITEDKQSAKKKGSTKTLSEGGGRPVM